MYLEGSYLHWLLRGFPGSLGWESCEVHGWVDVRREHSQRSVTARPQAMLVTGEGAVCCPEASQIGKETQVKPGLL